jgi:glycolate oxidase iron-sulfur subunit
MLPSLGLAAIDVLLAAKIRVVVGIDEGCCGMPRYVNGEISGTAQTARRNLDWLARVRGQGSQVASGSPLLFVCPSCAEAWKTYPELLQGREKEAAKTAAAAVVDVSTFLCRGAGDWRRLLREPPSSSPLTVTYHDPCHLAQAQGVRQDPRTLIAAIPGARFQEMSEPAGCCGSGGTFALFNAATARKIGQRKAKAIIATGAGLVATGCPACRLQLAQELVVAGHFVSVRHTVEVLAQALGWGDR